MTGNPSFGFIASEDSNFHSASDAAAPAAEVVRRRRTSLTFKVTPSNETKDTTGLFFKLTHNGHSIADTSDLIKVENLLPYTNATVDVYACYLPTFCSVPFRITELTNVGGKVS